MAAMLTDLANDLVPAAVARRLNSGVLIGLKKPDGGTRPITLGECFVKIASRIAIEASTDALRKTFRETQFGVNVSGGAEKIVHATRAFVRAAGAQSCVVTVDFANAFNSPSRQCMWERVRTFPYLGHCSRWNTHSAT